MCVWGGCMCILCGTFLLTRHLLFFTVLPSLVFLQNQEVTFSSFRSYGKIPGWLPVPSFSPPHLLPPPPPICGLKQWGDRPSVSAADKSCNLTFLLCFSPRHSSSFHSSTPPRAPPSRLQQRLCTLLQAGIGKNPPSTKGIGWSVRVVKKLYYYSFSLQVTAFCFISGFIVVWVKISILLCFKRWFCLLCLIWQQNTFLHVSW